MQRNKNSLIFFIIILVIIYIYSCGKPFWFYAICALHFQIDLMTSVSLGKVCVFFRKVKDPKCVTVVYEHFGWYLYVNRRYDWRSKGGVALKKTLCDFAKKVLRRKD